MANGRMLQRRISKNEQLPLVIQRVDEQLGTPHGAYAALLFTWSIPHQDVEGRMEGDPRIIRANVLPMLEWVTSAHIEVYLVELARHGLLVWYKAGGKKWIAFPGFAGSQPGLRRDKEAPSTIPAPEEGQVLAGELPSRSAKRQCTEQDESVVGAHGDVGAAAELGRNNADSWTDVQDEGRAADEPIVEARSPKDERPESGQEPVVASEAPRSSAPGPPASGASGSERPRSGRDDVDWPSTSLQVQRDGAVSWSETRKSAQLSATAAIATTAVERSELDAVSWSETSKSAPSPSTLERKEPEAVSWSETSKSAQVSVTAAIAAPAVERSELEAASGSATSKSATGPNDLERNRPPPESGRSGSGRPAHQGRSAGGATTALKLEVRSLKEEKPTGRLNDPAPQVEAPCLRTSAPASPGACERQTVGNRASGADHPAPILAVPEHPPARTAAVEQEFALQPPAQMKKSRKAGAVRDDVALMLEFYNAEWVKTRHPTDGKPPRCTAADYMQLRRLVGRFGVDEMTRLVQRYLDDDDPFLVKLAHSLRMLPSRVDGYRATTAPSSGAAVAGTRTRTLPLSSSLSSESRQQIRKVWP